MSVRLEAFPVAHLQGPIEPFTWAVLVVTGLFVAWTIVRAVLYTVRPGEDEPDHIKRSVLTEPRQIHVVAPAGRASQERRP